MSEFYRGDHQGDAYMATEKTRLTPEIDRAVAELLRTNAKVFLATAGAGAGITQLIWRTLGISRLLIGSVFPYHREEFKLFIGDQEFKGPYVSKDASVALALAAYKRAKTAEGSSSDLQIGVGLTAAVSTPSGNTNENKIFAAIRTREKLTAASVTMEKGYLSRSGEGEISDLIALNMLLWAVGVKQVALPDVHLISQDIRRQDSWFILEPTRQSIQS
ncbi:MAG: hypothetical protein A3H79_04010 [Candidatus Levybacteria bacterium RIFCSPLOWO2_02_FULL_36_8b]|nr:MAG: hypothetical protein A3H79_04010 [Candidatus Levybacteria bacterium RIFCSPLOWO2_02_FULL_36_8b]